MAKPTNDDYGVPADTPVRIGGWSPSAPAVVTAQDFLGSGFRGVNAFNAAQGLPTDPTYWDDMQAMGFRMARVALVPTFNGTDYVIPPEQFDVMDAGLSELAARDIVACLLLGPDTADMPFGSRQREAAYIRLHQRIGMYVAGRSTIVCVDGMNEPRRADGRQEPSDFVEIEAQWRDLANACVPAMRDFAPSMVYVYEVGLGSIPTNWLIAQLPSFSNFVLSPHHYIRYEITHQGVPQWLASQPLPPLLPYDATERTYSLADMAIVASRFPGVPVLYGEFSCVNWTPGAEIWVADVIQAAEAAGASWLYHAWRGAPWDSEAQPSSRNASPSTGLPIVRSFDAPIATVLRSALALPPGQYRAPGITT